MERADDLALLHQALAQRAPLVRTTVGESNDRLTLQKNGNPQPGRLTRTPPSRGNLVEPTCQDPLSHAASHLPNETRRNKTNDLGLASEVLPTVDSS